MSSGAAAANLARRAEELRRRIERANYAYYVLDAPVQMIQQFQWLQHMENLS